MGRIKEKEIILDADRVRAVITNDMKVYYKDPATNMLLPICENTALGSVAKEWINLFDEGDRLNQANGLYFQLTKKLLENFCFLRMSTEYARSESESIRKEREEDAYGFRPRYYTAYDEQDMVSIAESILLERSATRKMLRYFGKLDNIDRSAAAVRLITVAIGALKESRAYEWRLQAEILEMAYCTPENKGIKEELIIKSLGLKRGTYFNLKRSAISNVSRFLFGSMPNERGFIDENNPECMTALKKIFGEEKLQEILQDEDDELAKLLEIQ